MVEAAAHAGLLGRQATDFTMDHLLTCRDVDESSVGNGSCDGIDVRNRNRAMDGRSSKRLHSRLRVRVGMIEVDVRVVLGVIDVMMVIADVQVGRVVK